MLFAAWRSLRNTGTTEIKSEHVADETETTGPEEEDSDDSTESEDVDGEETTETQDEDSSVASSFVRVTDDDMD